MDLNPSLGFGFGLVDHSSFISHKLEGCSKSRRDGPDKRWYFGLSSHFMRFQYMAFRVGRVPLPECQVDYSYYFWHIVASAFV